MTSRQTSNPEDNLNEDYEDLKQQILSCYSSYLQHQYYASKVQWRPSTQAIKNVQNGSKKANNKLKQKKVSIVSPDNENEASKGSQLDKLQHKEEEQETKIHKKLNQKQLKFWAVFRP